MNPNNDHVNGIDMSSVFTVVLSMSIVSNMTIVSMMTNAWTRNMVAITNDGELMTVLITSFQKLSFTNNVHNCHSFSLLVNT